MMDDEKVPEPVRAAVRELGTPPEVPRDAMWQRIEATRRARRAAATGPVAQPRRRAPGILRWSLPLAAALALGIALGRLSLRDRAPEPAFVAAADTAPAAADATAARPYVLAAVQHLVSTEALLTSLEEDARTGQVREASEWARDLLTNTRLLKDTPAAADPQLAGLLDDLELILAQIAALPTAPPAQELRFIEDGIARNDVIGRLRAATTERPFAGT
jgi:hypothetical protein